MFVVDEWGWEFAEIGDALLGGEGRLDLVVQVVVRGEGLTQEEDALGIIVECIELVELWDVLLLLIHVNEC